MDTTLAVIDLDGLEPTSTRRAAIAAALDDAFRRTGFCYVAETGVEPALVEAVFDASRRFHALPAAARQAVAINACHRGYVVERLDRNYAYRRPSA